MIRVAVSGASGRMGSTACAAVEGAQDMELVARIDPALGVELAPALNEHHPDVLVDFSVQSSAAANIRTAVAAGVAAVAVVAFHQRADAPGLRPASTLAAQNAAPVRSAAPREAISYTVPATSPAAAASVGPGRLTNYVFAHSRYSSGLAQRGVLADLLIEGDEPPPAIEQAAAHVAP